MENDKMDLRDAASAIEGDVAYLEETADAFRVLYEEMETEGYQTKEDFKEWKALSFARRFPLYLPTLNVLIRVLRQNISEMRENVDTMYEAHRVQKGAAK